MYEGTHEKAHQRFQSVYTEVVSFQNKFGTKQKLPRLCGQNIYESEQHSFRNGQRTLAKYLKFLLVAFGEMKPRFVQEKR